MIKIGVFGDSFGAPSSTHPNHGDANIGMKYHWASLLANDLNAELTVEAQSGASLFFAYNKFMQNHMLYDTIIFTVPDCGRYPEPIDGRFHIVTLGQVDVLKKEVDPELLPKLEHAANWLTAAPMDYLITSSDLMVEKIKQIRPDAIIIPTCEYSISESKFNEMGLSISNVLVDLYYEQLAQLDISVNDINTVVVENPKLISGHFVPEIHEFFYGILKEKYDTGKWNWKKCPRLNFNHRPDEYFVPVYNK